MTPDAITANIPTFCRLSGLGRNKVYDLLRNGTRRSVMVGTRRLIVLDSWRQWVAENERAGMVGWGMGKQKVQD